MKIRHFLASLVVMAFFSMPLTINCNNKTINKNTATINNVSNAESETDVSRFNMRSEVDGASMSYNTSEKSITFTGKWDSSFVVTDQFNTYSKDFSFSTHVSSSNSCNNGQFGMNLFKLYQDHLSMYLVFDNTGTTISNISFIAPYSGVYDKLYAALDGEDFKEWGTFYTLSTASGFNKDPTTYLINPTKGFDITFYVKTTTYKEVNCQAFSAKINCFEQDGVTPAEVTSKTVYIKWHDKATSSTDNSRAAIKPQIGFYSMGITDIKVSNIVFTDLETSEYKSQIETIGDSAKITSTFDLDNQTINVDSSETCSSCVLLNTLNNDSQDFEIEADISGVGDNQSGITVGFTLYYDEENFCNYFLEWDNDATHTYPVKMTSHYTINEQYIDVCRVARNPWETSLSTYGEWYGNFNDYGGWGTDAYLNCGQPSANFNKFRDELYGQTKTISTGFKLGLIKHRVMRFGTLVDEIALKFTTTDKTGVTRNWYSCALDVDAFTYPLGAESELINEIPKIGLYAFHNEGITSNVTFSNIKFNGHSVLLQGMKGLTISEHQTNYQKGDTFAFNGKVKLNYNDSSLDRELDSDEYTITGPTTEEMETLGNHNITVTYKDNTSISTTYQITVLDPDPTNLNSITLSNTTSTYYVGDELIKPTVTAHYGNNTDIVVTNLASFTGYDMSKAGEQTVTVSYTKGSKTVTATYQITVVANLVDISIDTDHSKTKFNVGDEFVAPTVMAIFDGGAESVDISGSENLSYSGYDMSVFGEQTVTVTYLVSGYYYSNTYNIEVISNLVSIRVVMPQTEFNVGDEFVKPSVAATYSGTSEIKNVSDKCTSTGYDMNTAGTQEVTVTYGEGEVEVETTYEINVIAKLIKLTINNAKTSYNVGESFITPTVIASYESGKEDTDVSKSVSISGYDKTKIGNQTVTISYTEGSITLTEQVNINVNDKSVNVGLVVGLSVGGIIVVAASAASFFLVKKHKIKIKKH